MKPYFEITEEIKSIIMGLRETCKAMELGNVAFDIYSTACKTDVSFFLTEYKSGWELVVKHKQQGSVSSRRHYIMCTDIYKIENGALEYERSEEDELAFV